MKTIGWLFTIKSLGIFLLALFVVVALQTATDGVCQEANQRSHQTQQHNYDAGICAVAEAIGEAISTLADTAAIFAAAAALLLLWYTRLDYLSRERPRLRVRNVLIEPLSKGKWFAKNALIKGELWVVNNGSSRATIFSSHCQIYTSQATLPMHRPYETSQGNGFMDGTVLEAGKDDIGTFTEINGLGKEGAFIQSGAHGWKFWIMGWVEYRDELGIARYTRFCRQWNPTNQRFDAVTDPDYEHED